LKTEQTGCQECDFSDYAFDLTGDATGQTGWKRGKSMVRRTTRVLFRRSAHLQAAWTCAADVGKLRRTGPLIAPYRQTTEAALLPRSLARRPASSDVCPSIAILRISTKAACSLIFRDSINSPLARSMVFRAASSPFVLSSFVAQRPLLRKPRSRDIEYRAHPFRLQAFNYVSGYSG
jgi:hypothetical protein